MWVCVWVWRLDGNGMLTCMRASQGWQRFISVRIRDDSAESTQGKVFFRPAFSWLLLINGGGEHERLGHRGRVER